MDEALASGRAALSEKKLTLYLQRSDGAADTRVTSVEINSQIARIKSTFKSDYTLEDVLPGNLVSAIRTLLEQLKGPVQTYANPDFSLTNEESQLSGLRMVAHKMLNGVQNIVVYFSRLRGYPQDFLASRFHEDLGLAPRAEDINASILGDIAIPFLNLVQHVCTNKMPEGPIGALGERLKAHANEAVFRVELLKRLQRSQLNPSPQRSSFTSPDAITHRATSERGS